MSGVRARARVAVGVGTAWLAVVTAGPAVASPANAGPVEVVPLWEAVERLPVAAEDRTGYDRDAFEHWIDVDRDGCNTRREVLIDEAVQAPQVGRRCKLSGGLWYSYYDNVERTDRLDIDHMVPLAEAWDSGARGWTFERRREYANDLGDHRALVAVTDTYNRQKADKDPAQWRPPYEPARCRYYGEWTAIKLRWRLSADPAEKAALTAYTQNCPNDPITITPAP
ncbi:HNH endonuclease family protein [Thermomonospora umbrina]|uniref:HNH endonuclease family protein n=1 Tax=Thermomonospora umbrina TaxID=111806 RepID=UPI001FE8F1BE|nr:HNH endonuclease family protein [Thermomonospora umbrina]